MEYWDDWEGDNTTASTTSSQYVSTSVHPIQEHADRDGDWNRGQSSSYRMHDNSYDNNSWDSRPRNSDRSFSGRGRRQPFGNDGNGYRSNEDFSEIQINSNYVGRVIGKGGSKIQELQSESGARIKVMKDSDSNGCTSVRLTGSSEAQEKAKTLIEELTAEFNNMSTRNSFAQSTPEPSNSVYIDSETGLIDWDLLNKNCEEMRKIKLAALPPIVKEFYIEDPDVAVMSKREVAVFRAENNNITVNVVDSDDKRAILNPVTSFKQAFQHYPELLEELKKQGFTTPSPIQSQAWPILMSGYDMIGIAQTGTGKTIAFLFPALIHIIGQVVPREKRVGPTCLVLAPTRELAQQILSETKKYSYHNIKSVCIYGGGSRREQIGIVTKGIDIVIATPGRLNDLVMNKIVDVTGVTYLVLDEADRMLDMGFEPQIRKIVLDIREDRQTVMTSATWSGEIQELAARYMTKPFKINVGALDLAAVHSVHQEVIFASDEERRQILEEFLANMEKDDKVIVFVERKSIVDDLSSDMACRGIVVQSIHGDREQYDREQALQDLKTGDVRILIATDVASRGLDVKDITHVFNMYFPRNIEEYVHRVGRTGRAGRTGVAISIFTREDWMQAESFIKILEEADQFVPQELYDMADRYRAWRQKKDAEDAEAGGRRFRGGRGRRRF